MILVVGQHPDAHIEAVSTILRDRGIPVCLLDRYSTADRITIEISGGRDRASVHTGGKTLSLSEVSCVWWRVKPAAPVEYPGGTGTLGEQFRAKEWHALLRSLPAWLSHVPWVNPLINYQQPRTKPAQLMLAREAGFAVPETVISNDVDQIMPLFEQHAQVIYKTLDSFMIPPDKIIYTNIATRDDVLRRRGEISLAPCMFQSLVEKKLELRVTVAGERMFAVAINSQADVRTRVDWRRDQSLDMYSAADLTESQTSRIRMFMQKASLSYGAFDFIVTPQDELVFLECNPGGQWLWLEKATRLPISEAVAELLARPPQPPGGLGATALHRQTQAAHS